MGWFRVFVLLFLASPLPALADFSGEVERSLRGEERKTLQPVAAKPTAGVGLGEVFTVPFYRERLFVLTVLGVLLALFGVFVALRGDVFITLTISQAAACGIAAGLLLHLPAVLPSGVLLLLALWVLAVVPKSGFRNRTMVMGALFTGFSALSVLLLSRAAEGEGKLVELLFSSLLLLDGVTSVIFLLVGALLLHLLLRRLYMALLFDRVSLEFEGVPVAALDFMAYLVHGFVLMAVVRMAGLFFPLAFTILLPAAVLIRARSLHGALVAAGLGALFTVPVVFTLAVLLDLPVTAALTSGAVLFYLGSLLRR